MSEDGGRERHPLLDIRRRLVKLMRDGRLHRDRQLGLMHHLTNEIAIAFLRGNASRRGMRLAQIAHFCESSHLVADGCRRKTKTIMYCQPLRTDRLGRFNVVSYDQ